MPKLINYVIIFYIINIVVGLLGFLFLYEANPIFRVLFSILQIVFLAFGGYLNAKKQKKILSVLWIGFFNLVIGLAGIYALEVLGAEFNIFGGSSDSVMIVLFQYTINSYLYPFLDYIEDISESLTVVFIIFCSFAIPLIGYVIGKNIKSNNVKTSENS